MDQEAQPSSDAGLLDSVSIADENEVQQNPVATEIDHKVAPEEDDGPLERPDWWLSLIHI